MTLEAIDKLAQAFSDYEATVINEKVQRLRHASRQRAEAIYALRVEIKALRHAVSVLELENRSLWERAKDAESRLETIKYLTGDKR